MSAKRGTWQPAFEAEAVARASAETAGRRLGASATQPDERATSWLDGKLVEAMFGAPATMAIYVAGLSVANLFLWERTADSTTAVLAAIALALAAFRGSVMVAFWRLPEEARSRRGKMHVDLYCVAAWLCSLDLAALSLRTLAVGDLPSIVMAIQMLTGYLVGLIMRAALVRFAVPSLVLLFAPLIAAGAFAAGGEYIVVAILLVLLCLACVHYASAARGALVAQLSAERRLFEMVGRDSLTGLANRAGIEAHLTELRKAAGARHRPFSLAVIDLDGFKSVNDSRGHAAGDRLLQMVTGRLRNVLKDLHLPARLGGDEFVVLFDPGIDESEAARCCESIVRALRTPFLLPASMVAISASIGLARSARGADTFEETFAVADAALYSAKQQGRDHVRVAGSIDAGETRSAK